VSTDDISNNSSMVNKRSFQSDSNINHVFTMCVKSLTLFVPGVRQTKLKRKLRKFGMGCALEDEECGETAIKKLKGKTILKWKIRVKLGYTTNLVSIAPEVERLMQEAIKVNEGIRPGCRIIDSIVI
jgi:hypothetical protein